MTLVRVIAVFLESNGYVSRCILGRLRDRGVASWVFYERPIVVFYERLTVVFYERLIVVFYERPIVIFYERTVP